MLYWFKRLQEIDFSQIEFICSRILVGLSERSEAADAIVDLMIAIESIFGSSGSAITFKVSAAVAALLEKDLEERKSVFTRFKQLYRTRSRIVHGDLGEIASIERDLRDLANYALKVIEKLIGDRKDVLEEKADKRVEMILLYGQLG